MCIILFQWQPDNTTPIILAANRDEFYQRPTAAAEWRGDIFCGLDLRAGGTWLGVSRSGRFAAVTNFREPALPTADNLNSRGDLPLDFLQGADSPEAYLNRVMKHQDDYGPFNLLVGDRQQLWYASNRGAEAQPVKPGIHGLSNGLLDTPWPKVERGKRLLKQAISAGASDADLIKVLTDQQQPDDQTLPNTGFSPDFERMLATIFIESPQYGTRCSTLLTLSTDDKLNVVEHIWN